MLKWALAIVFFVSLAATGILLEKPKGNIAGTIKLETPADTLGRRSYSTENIKESRARVIAYGQVVRASYVDSEGNFRIDGLPVGEYRLRFVANGYSSNTKWGIKVKEAETTTLSVVKLSYLPSSVSIASDSKVFTTEEKPYFWFRSTGIKNLKVTLYSFDALEEINHFTGKRKRKYVDFLVGNYYYGSNDFLNTLIADREPIKNWKKRVVYGFNDYARTPLKINKKLPSGSYLLKVEGKSNIDNKKREDIYWFAVSDLGIITKHDPSRVLIRAVNLVTLKSYEDVKLTIYDRSTGKYEILGNLTTDKDGLAEYHFKESNLKNHDYLLITARKGDSVALNSSYTWFSPEEKYKVYVYTDRPIYRPDQTVYFKGIVRKEAHKGLENITGKLVEVTVYNPASEPLKKFTLKTSKFGTYNALLDLPRNASLGNYRITTKIDGNEYDSYFEVSEYRKPEYKVEVIPGSERVIGGQKATATVKATYFFGYPVTNARIEYTVYSSPNYGLKWKLLPRPDYYAYYDDWDEEDSYYYTGYDYGSSAGEIIAKGYATTDENGEARITFKTKKLVPDEDSYYVYADMVAQKYKIEAEVTDISRKTVLGSGSFNVVSGDYAMFLDPDSYVYTEDQDIKLNVKTINYDKKSVSAEVKLLLQCWTWEKKEW